MAKAMTWQVSGDKDGVPHPTPKMWGEVSKALDGVSLPAAVVRAIIMLEAGQLSVTKTETEQPSD